MKKIETRQTDCYITKDDDGTIRVWRNYCEKGVWHGPTLPRYIKKGQTQTYQVGFLTVEDPPASSGYWDTNDGTRQTVYREGISPSYEQFADLPFDNQPIRAKMSVNYYIEL